jgi:SLOG family protein/SIR2-like protein
MLAVEMRVFLKEYTRALREGDSALFVGSGISRSAGYVDWKQLLKGIAEDLDLDIDREADLVALAQYHVNRRGGRDRLNQLLIDEFLEDVELTPSHHLIASLPVHTIWTTNYDDLLEVAFSTANKRVDVKRRQEDFSVTRRRTDVTIYKMHGDKSNPAEAILTKEDYETYDTTRELFTIALKSDLAKKTFLFLGFSFADPNVMYILGRVKQLLETNSRKHYCVLKAPKAEDHGGGEYESKRFSHWLADLHRYNIQPILIGGYDEVPGILAELSRRSHLRDVFISGSAAEFEPLGQERFRELCRSVGTELIKKEFNIISGFGLGVGDLVIIGAMQSLPRNDDERLQLWPFPQQVPAGTDRAVFWRQYRERMISNAGVCIVLGGNKLVSGAVVPADGVRQEVEIARSQGKSVIPIGATGYVARELWEQCRADPSAFIGNANVTSQLEILGDSAAGVPALVEAIIEILKQLDK